MFLTEKIDAYEGRDIMALDVPNTFIQTNMPPKKYGVERVITKITGVLVYILLELDNEIYRKHVMFENRNELIYIVVLRSINGMFLAALLLYNKFCGDLEKVGFEFNPYYPCVTNRIKFGKKHTVIFHMDNVMPIHVNPNVNYKFKGYMKLNYFSMVK